ncbi:MAG: electron transport complex subunit E [Oscillospiraceae bacterium]|nr:electron transport complex subunit E [Oscillospiraceae bacterium]
MMIKQLKEGVLDNNPLLIQLLGICPALAMTTNVSNALGIGIATMVVLLLSNLFISLLRKLIPNEIRIAAYIVIIAGFVSAVEMLIKAYLPELGRSLGIFLPLIVVNCIILGRAETFASKNKVLPSLMDGFAMGFGFTFALIVVASIREIIGAGTWFGVNVLGESYQSVLFFIMPSGAFITLGCLVALMKKLTSFPKKVPKNSIESLESESVTAEKVEEPVEIPAEEEVIVEEIKEEVEVAEKNDN